LSSRQRRRHSLVVIGGGSAGLVAVDFGAPLVPKVLLIESDCAKETLTSTFPR